MRNINKSRILTIIIFVVMLVVMAGRVYADTDDSTGTKDNKTSFLENIEGSQEDLNPYTIESIIFNQVPLFDANVFTETAAGKQVKSDSVMGIVRKITAVWYVSFRNVALVVMAFLIIYYGIRLAIATVSSEKAHYKEFLIGWIKSFIIILVMHYIIYAVLFGNNYIVNLLSNINDNEGKIYNTIKTRALEIPWKICVPATIMYLTLLVMWIRFIWTYFKRLFSIVMLIILAPLVGIRYAIENATGKGSRIVSNWFQKFFTSVFIQSIHALLYVIFVQTALEISLQDLNGFIVAMFFLNFMLSADTIFTNIFKFEFDPDDVQRINKPFKRKEQLAEAYAAYYLGKTVASSAMGVGKAAVNFAGNEAHKAYIKGMDKLDDLYGGDHREAIESRVNGMLNNIDNRLLEHIENNNLPKGQEIGGIRREISNRLRLRKMSRLKGMEGARAKYALKLSRSKDKKRFKSNFRIIKNLAYGAGEIILLVPIGVQNPEAAITMLGDITGRISDAHRESKKIKDNKDKYDRPIDGFVESIISADRDMDKIEKQMEKLEPLERKEAVEELKKVKGYGISHSLLVSRIRTYMRVNNITEINDKVLNSLISEIVYTLPDTISEDDKFKIKQIAMDNIQQPRIETETEEITDANEPRNMPGGNAEQLHETTENEEKNEHRNTPEESTEQLHETKKNETEERDKNSKRTQRTDRSDENNDEERKKIYNYDEVAHAIENAVIETKVDKKFGEMAKAINDINDINRKEERKKDSYGPVVDTNVFLQSFE